MKNLKFLLLTLFLFVFMIPVKAMPCYSVHKTESIFNKQPEVSSVVCIGNIQKQDICIRSRAKVPLFPFSETHKDRDFEFREKVNYVLDDSQFLKNKLPNNFLLDNLPDKKN